MSYHFNATGTLGAEDFPPERTGDGGAPRGIPFPAPLRDIVHAVATETLALCGGNKSEAARQLGITRPRLLRLLDDTTDESSTEATDDATT